MRTKVGRARRTAVHCTIDLSHVDARVLLRVILAHELLPERGEVLAVAAIRREMFDEPG